MEALNFSHSKIKKLEIKQGVVRPVVSAWSILLGYEL